jgi:uncharacterized protein (DUF885 family)
MSRHMSRHYRLALRIGAMAAALFFPIVAMTASPTDRADGKPPATTGVSKEDAKLAALFKNSDEAQLKLSPLTALGRGDLRYADQFGDNISDRWYADMEAQAKRELRQLDGIEREKLSPKQKIAYDVFRYNTENAVRSYELGLARIAQKMPIDHQSGAQITFPQTSSGEDVAPYKTAKDYDDGLKRIGGFVLYLDRAEQQMRRGIASGHVLTRAITEKIVLQLDDALKAGIDGSPFMKPIAAFPDGLPDQERRRLSAEYRAAVGEKVLPAFATLRRFMADEYLPASRTGAPGLIGMPDGALQYAFALELHTTTRMSADEIHALGVSEVARIEREMEEIKTGAGFRGTLREFFAHLQKDPALKFETREALLEGYRRIQQRVEPILPRMFDRQPSSRLEVKAVPTAQEPFMGGAYYVIGTADGERPGTFYVNTSDLPSRTRPRMTALFLHEGSPGHHLQGSTTLEDSELPAFLRYGWNAGYGEGWALYSEWLGYEMGLYDDPLQRFGRLDMEMLRAMRLVVDTGLHAEGWSREQAIQYMLDHSSFDRGTVEQEVDRYVAWPGQATAYKIGEIFIRRLRSKAEQALGDRFDLRAFHRQVIDTGPIPLAVLERKIDDWIAQQR